MRSIEVPDEVALAFESASPARREAAFASVAGWLRSGGPTLEEVLQAAEARRERSDLTDQGAMEAVLAEIAAHRTGH